MKLAKYFAKFLVVALLAFTFVRPLGIPKLPPVQQVASAVTTVHYS